MNEHVSTTDLPQDASTSPHNSDSARRTNAREASRMIASPSKPNASPTNKHKSSPSKHANKLSIDPNGTLAAISAKLSTMIMPAESEIVRINREALASVSKRYQLQLTQTKAREQQDIAAERRETQQLDDSDGSSSTCPPLEGLESTPTVASPLKGSSMPPALHESIIAEEWVNVHLETNGTFLLPATDIQSLLQKTSAARGNDSVDDDDNSDRDSAAATFTFRKHGSDSSPLGRAGIDRASLYCLGMPKDLVDRLYRALYVYTNGFHNLINEIAAHCPPLVERHVSSNVWLTFLLLLEQCENGKYEMAMLKFKQATQAWRQQTTDAFDAEKRALVTQLQIMQARLEDETQRSVEKSNVLAKLADDAITATQTIATQHTELVAQSEQLRLLKLELLVRDDDAQQLNDQLDAMRRDFEVANSERINALAERIAADDELQRMQSDLERIEAEKASGAKRIHEGLFMNQALRATNETLKQSTVVLAMERDRVRSDRDALYAQLQALQLERQAIEDAKVLVERSLVDAQRRHEHLEARIDSMKEQFALEAAATATHVQEIARLQRAVDEEHVKVGVLDAQCNLLTAEKQNTGMRAQDKLRIERLLNQKLELEHVVEALKLDRAKDQEQIWSLRASLEALDTEMQHSKRVFAAGQQAFLHSERTCEQLRSQLQDVEKNYEKASKNLTSLKERFKLFDENSKDQITKLEVELKVASAQLREVSYANRDNTATIIELTKTIEASAKELTAAKTRLESSAQRFTQLQAEKEHLQRDHTQRELQRSTSRDGIEKFVRALQHILALVKRDEYPLDEALRDVLRLARELFGKEIDLDGVLDADDEVEEFEEALEDEDDEEGRKQRRGRRRNDLVASEDDDSDDEDDRDGDENATRGRQRTHVASMSKFRKSQLDQRVKKLERDVENKRELVTSLEGVVCEQAEHAAQLTRTIEQHEQLLALQANQVGMVLADVDATTIAWTEARSAQQHALAAQCDAERRRDSEIERACALQHTLARVRCAFDRECIATEDLLSRIWRAYEHYLWMLSLRRNESVQATVTTAEHAMQTLTPQRNPANERARLALQYLPAPNPTASTFEDVIQQINRNARVLLPEATTDISFSLALQQQQQQQQQQHDAASSGLDAAVPAAPAVHRSANDRSRREHESQPQQQQHKRMLGGGKHARVAQHARGLPALEQARTAQSPHIIRHVNEFGLRQDVLISPVYPPYFSESKVLHHAASSPSSTKTPRKPEHQPSSHRHTYRRRQQQQQQQPSGATGADDGDERSSSPSMLQQQQQQPTRRYDALSDDDTENGSGDTGLRYHRGFLRTGMEVLRGVASSFPEDDDEDDEDAYEDGEGYNNGHTHDALSPRSPGRLEAAIRGYQRAQTQDEALQRQRAVNDKDEQQRSAALASLRPFNINGRDDGRSVDPELVQELSASARFTPAVLYPLLPAQRQSSDASR